MVLFIVISRTYDGVITDFHMQYENHNACHSMCTQSLIKQHEQRNVNEGNGGTGTKAEELGCTQPCLINLNVDQVLFAAMP